jgi:type IV secretory pathway TraG/TraD family ATPase VirD4
VDDAVNFGRSLGVKFMIGIQNVEQVYENYGEQRARSIMSGFSTSVAFRVNDAASKEHIKDLHGENRKKEIYMSSVQSRGIQESIREAHVVEDWDISNLGLGEAIIGLPGKPPFSFKFKKA